MPLICIYCLSPAISGHRQCEYHLHHCRNCGNEKKAFKSSCQACEAEAHRGYQRGRKQEEEPHVLERVPLKLQHISSPDRAAREINLILKEIYR